MDAIQIFLFGHHPVRCDFMQIPLRHIFYGIIVIFATVNRAGREAKVVKKRAVVIGSVS